MLWLPIGAFIAIVVGIFITASFNGVMSFTNSNKFCYSCHIGMDTIVEEYHDSIHFNKARGVALADCADCHVPKAFFPKMLVKIRATKDVYHMLAGTINLENFESHRGAQAEGVWEIMLENKSQACKSCHDYENWDLSEQSARARKKHNPEKWAQKEQSCIDCHTGVAHQEPSI